MIEAGVPDYEASSWYGLLAPAATPRAIIDRLHRETVEVLRNEEIRARLIEQGLDPVGNTPREFAGAMHATNRVGEPPGGIPVIGNALIDEEETLIRDRVVAKTESSRQMATRNVVFARRDLRDGQVVQAEDQVIGRQDLRLVGKQQLGIASLAKRCQRSYDQWGVFGVKRGTAVQDRAVHQCGEVTAVK